MQKVNCIATYLETEKGYQLYTLYVTTRSGESVRLLGELTAYDNINNVCKIIEPYTYTRIADMYSTVLNTLKNNNMYTGYTYQFGKYYHNIDFVDLSGGKVHRYPTNKKR